MRRTSPIVSFALVTLAVVTSQTEASAGALVGATRPRLAVETALVAWDPSTNVEHLFLAARFDRIDGPFAWWLPVPSTPEVEVVDDDLSMMFVSLVASYRARAKHWELPSLPGGAPRDALSFGGRGAVDARAHALPSRGAVDDVLEQAGRSRDLALKDYLLRYVEGRYHVVELRADPGTESWTSPWIHLRFETNQPWYPYREPAYPPRLNVVDEGSRLLRLYVLAPERVAMQHGQSVPTMAYAWLAFEPTHEEVRRALGARLAGALALDPSRRLWLTSFEDRHVVRPGDDDLRFASAGLIPKEGAPGTIGDAAGTGIAFRPLGAPTVGVERETGVAVAAATRAARGPGRRTVGPVQVFGVMVLMALGIAWGLSRSEGRGRGRNLRHRT